MMLHGGAVGLRGHGGFVSQPRSSEQAKGSRKKRVRRRTPRRRQERIERGLPAELSHVQHHSDLDFICKCK